MTRIPLLLVLGLLIPAPLLSQTVQERDSGVRIERNRETSPRREADDLLHKGRQQRDEGNYEEAIALWQQALELYTQMYDWGAMTHLYTQLGSAYAQLDNLRQAQQMFEAQVSLTRRRDNRRALMAGLNNLGTVLLRRGQLDAAQTHFEEALALATESNVIRVLGLTYSNLGLLEASRGNHRQAISLYEQALQYRIQARDVSGQANTFNHLGDAYWALDDYENAIANYGAALRQVEGRESQFENYLRAIDGLATAHQSVGRYLRAQELLEARLERVRERGDLRQEMRSLEALAQLHLAAGERREAIRLYSGAIALAEQLEDIRAVSALENALSPLIRP
ncbi:tetratricopeptide repeat protein [Phormidium yuhuli AB48]|uniref:Tetratricopeptide repeat protein n=1 Tax=Phormidium yuhuli AB48 TaxID=2940671 RepID=A0ABY5AY10_9CYAN|nr:tetratricopeptide repeat protein [Phormidium yuhuli]USR92958.1 tetratricopeptide repeat protein [Phormidium yuhuli AB48]